MEPNNTTTIAAGEIADYVQCRRGWWLHKNVTAQPGPLILPIPSNTSHVKYASNIIKQGAKHSLQFAKGLMTSLKRELVRIILLAGIIVVLIGIILFIFGIL